MATKAELEVQVAELQAQIAELTNKKTTNDKSLRQKLRARKNELQEKIDIFQAHKDELILKIDSLRAEVDEINTQLSALLFTCISYKVCYC